MSYLRLKDVLKEKGVTGKDLANQLGVSENTISFISSGKQQPRFELLEQIASALDVDIRDLFISTKEGPTSAEGLIDVIQKLTTEYIANRTK